MDKKTELVLEIVRLVQEVNTLTPCAAFFRLAGHVNLLEVEVTPSKRDYNQNLIDFRTYIDDEAPLAEIIEVLKDTLQEHGCEAGHTTTTRLDQFSTSHTSECVTALT